MLGTVQNERNKETNFDPDKKNYTQHFQNLHKQKISSGDNGKGLINGNASYNKKNTAVLTVRKQLFQVLSNALKEKPECFKMKKSDQGYYIIGKIFDNAGRFSNKILS